MVMALDGLTRLCPLILFDWRLYAERGCPRFFHTHSDAKRTDDCELGFLKQFSLIEHVYTSHIHGILICLPYKPSMGINLSQTVGYISDIVATTITKSTLFF
ncbi:uncharacterized protein CDAR_534931 [Caerostris darwini]|uniref:Uncharacterized protein n=1 Tax=Caerostris darwini TaxID=1538125 RepID=A0AAV4QLK1_9ARAC|nr:uncharacterized protein CDAR_534931 [Caerostris darwini]